MPLIPPAAKIPLPIQERLSEFFVDLLGKGTAASKAKELKVKRSPDAPPVMVAVWEDKWGRVGAVCVAELMMAAIAGAALVLAPASVLPEVEREGRLPDHLRDNFHEVMNVLTTTIRTDTSPQLKLVGIFQHPEEPLPEPVWEVLTSSSSRRDFELTVEGYGGGRLSILTR
jgi:hypothetical protein